MILEILKLTNCYNFTIWKIHKLIEFLTISVFQIEKILEIRLFSDL